MRLHHLSITAFGPFAETVEVDFDELSSAGLFLLTGATGSGKTSVLDAVSFALYGDVPGDRSAAKRFRCDNAAPGVAPQVRLETTLSGRRFRITRSPSWVRPKKRGTGTTTEQPRVIFEERLNGEWVGLSTRLDETGQLVASLVGMNMGQFCQVAMLPQGDFQAFLRASSEERHHLLQQLFSTQRFSDIEHWLREHARGLHREVQGRQRDVSRVVSRFLEATSAALPEDWSGDDLTPLLDDGQLQAWVTAQCDDAANARQATTVRAEEHATRSESARKARDEGFRLSSLQARAQAASAEAAQLASQSEQQEAHRDRLVLARKAAPLAPLHRHAQSTGQERDRAAESAQTAYSAACAALERDDVSAGELADAAREAHRAHTIATALLPREPELDSLRQRIAATETGIQNLEAREESLAAQTAELPARISSLAADLDVARNDALRAQSLADELTALDQRLEAGQRLLSLRSELQLTETERTVAVDQCLRLKEDWLDLREARIAGMAAELAHDLAVGGSCPVCGSADHPNKAESAPDAPTPETEKQARRQLDDSEITRAAVGDRARELTLSISGLEHQAGATSLEVLQVQRRETEASLITARAGAARSGALESGLALATRTLDATRTDLGATGAELAVARTRHEGDTQAAARLAKEIDQARGDYRDLSSLVAGLSALAATCERALRQQALATAAAETATTADSAVELWLSENGFTDVDQTATLLLTPNELDELARSVASHDSAIERASSVLADPDVAAAAGLTPPDLAALEEADNRLSAELDAARAALVIAERRSTRLASLTTELSTAIEAWAPIRASHRAAAELAAFVEGKSSDNELRMRLSAYVLAWRLTQVVAAANERLVTMSDGRYTLEHTGRKGAGERRGGLSLLVRDEWSGEARDPATLSGGETFVVSLALALGLADVVTRESGGANLDTLFVDEGFGTLDSETLDDVMDTLDSLRDGGRVVGVVSHVAEMRSRIPTHLVVSKDRSGSTVTISRDLT